jgi:hypothetical protein
MAGRITAGAGFGIAIFSRRAFARMRFNPSSASFARASSVVAAVAPFVPAAGSAARVEPSFGSRVSGACFAAPERSEVLMGRALPSDNI